MADDEAQAGDGVNSEGDAGVGAEAGAVAESAARIDIPTWKPDWAEARRHHEQWWRGEGLVLSVTAPLDEPREMLSPPAVVDARDQHVGVPGRVLRSADRAARTFYGGDAPPHPGTMCVGPGDLAAMLGGGWRFSRETVWYEPCIDDPSTHRPLVLDRESDAFVTLTALVKADMAAAAGRYFTGIPDLIENIDILAALRGPEALLMDMYDHPAWIERSLYEINRAFFEVFDHFYALTRDAWGNSLFAAFNAWGPGKTAKVQCDACAMFGPAQFEQFVVPALTEQCEWLDQSMYHLDGEECWPNLDLLLGIESLDAIEWTPKQAYGAEGGGHPKWYELYHRIKSAGKSVQAIQVKPSEVEPLLDAVGPEGMYLVVEAATQADAEQLVDRVSSYRPSGTR